MRSSLFVLGVLAGIGTPAMAQSAFDGPLAAPGVSPSESARPKAKPKHPRHTAKAFRPAADGRAAPTAPAAENPVQAAPDDPVSLGMKWNGSNDTAAQTRWQNLNGNAAGTGAEVGLKLHF